MLRNLRSISEDTESVTEIVGLILMITVALVAATTVQVYLGNTDSFNRNALPMISMSQIDDYLVITDVQYGPVGVNEINFTVYDGEQNYICNGDLLASGENIASGDIVTFNNCVLNSREAYFVWAMYEGGQIGKEKYTSP